MTPRNERVYDDIEVAKSKYASELDGIINRPLVPEIIDTYASGALDDLISLVQRSTDDYGQRFGANFDTIRRMEDAAFDYYGLGDIGATLDHIADKADEIKNIDDVINKSRVVDYVILPSDDISPNIVGGDGSFEINKSIPRLKTLLFVLANEFGVDVDNRKQLCLTRGKVDQNMMRQESYYLVEVPELERAVLVCDEVGNVTFVFDTKETDKLGVSNDGLMNCKKSMLNGLIEEKPELGSSVIYSKNFIPRLIATIREPGKGSEELDVVAESLSGGANYLCLKATSDHLSVNGVATYHDIDNKTVYSIIEKLGEKIGPAEKRKFYNQITDAYDLYQQAVIEDYCREHGLLLPEMPEDHMTLRDFVNSVDGVWYTSAEKAAKHLVKIGELGEIKKYKKGKGRGAFGYSPQQRQILFDHLDINGEVVPVAPEGYLSRSGIAKQYEHEKRDVNAAIKQLSVDRLLGDTKEYVFGHNKTDGYSPEQINLVVERVVQNKLNRQTKKVA